jgi:S1-C subfamily serine protease/tetratricopeptide (TPR) repeat protein
MFSYGAATPGQKSGRAPRGSVSKAADLVDKADKLAEDLKSPEAIEAYKLAIQLDPNYAPAHGGLGDAYLNSGNWPQALAEYKEQVRLAPNSAEAQYDLGYSYNVMGRHGEAFAPLVKATALDPTFAEAFYEIGYAYLRGANFEKSIPFFRSAIRLMPDYGDAYYGLGLVYARQGEVYLAKEQLKKLGSLDAKLAGKLEKEIPGALETAAAGRSTSEPAKQSVETETHPSAPLVAAKRARVVTQPVPTESAQPGNSPPAEPSTSTSSLTTETASRQSAPVSNRQKQSAEFAGMSASNSQSQINQVQPQAKRATPKHRERSGTISPQGPQQPSSDGDWTEIVRQTMPGVVSIQRYDAAGKPIGTGTGFTVASDGIVVTNFHVIEGASAAQVTTRQGEKFDITGVIEFDAVKDFALVKIPAFDLPTVPLGNSNDAEVGESAIAIGDSLGEFAGSVSSGIISATAREVEGSTWIQTTTPVSHGNSGGPLLNRRGEVIGVISRGRTDGQNLNFAVPINYVRGALQLGTTVKVRLPELVKALAELKRAAFEKTFTTYSDPAGMFNLGVLREWRIQHDLKAVDNGLTADVTIFAPQRAALAEIGGYLSEGLRVTVYLPPTGNYFTPEMIENAKNKIPEQVLVGNPGFEVNNSGMFMINGLQAKIYTIDGKGPKLSEAERTKSYVFGNQKAIVQIDVVVPQSRLAALDTLDQLAKSFEFKGAFLASAGAPPPSPGVASGSPSTTAVTPRDLELSFRSNLFDDTIRNAMQLLQTTPNSPEAHAYLGLSLLFKRDVDNAVIHLEQAIFLGQAITLPAKRLREPLFGHGLDDATVTLTKESVTIRSGKSVFQAGFSALSESRMGNYNNTCPVAFLKGQFLDGSNNKGKTSEKGFNLFPPSAGLTRVQQGTLFYNVAVCNDEGTMTTAIIKLLYQLTAHTR